jgi:hypothetical protein
MFPLHFGQAKISNSSWLIAIAFSQLHKNFDFFLTPTDKGNKNSSALMDTKQKAGKRQENCLL